MQTDDFLCSQKFLCTIYYDRFPNIKNLLNQEFHVILINLIIIKIEWASTWDFGTYLIGEQKRLRRACENVRSHQSLSCLQIQSMNIDESKDIN